MQTHLAIVNIFHSIHSGASFQWCAPPLATYTNSRKSHAHTHVHFAFAVSVSSRVAPACNSQLHIRPKHRCQHSWFKNEKIRMWFTSSWAAASTYLILCAKMHIWAASVRTCACLCSLWDSGRFPKRQKWCHRRRHHNVSPRISYCLSNEIKVSVMHFSFHFFVIFTIALIPSLRS